MMNRLRAFFGLKPRPTVLHPSIMREAYRSLRQENARLRKLLEDKQ